MYKLPAKKKKVTLEEVEFNRRKQEYERNIQIKTDLLDKEFSKILQQQRLEESSAFANEVNLRKCLNDVLTSNSQKFDELYQINDQIYNMDREDSETLGKQSLRSTYRSKSTHNASSHFMSRTVTSSLPFSPKPTAENLGARLNELEDVLKEVEVRLTNEADINKTLENRLIVMTNDKKTIMKKKKILEVTVVHATSRFNNMSSVDFLANSKLAETKSTLQEQKESIEKLEAKEQEILDWMNKEKQSHSQQLQGLKLQMSKTLIKIDENTKIAEKCDQQLDELDDRGFVVTNKKSDSKYTTEYIDVLKKIKLEYLEPEPGVEESDTPMHLKLPIIEERGGRRSPTSIGSLSPSKMKERGGRKATISPSNFSEFARPRYQSTLIKDGSLRSSSTGKISPEMNLSKEHIYYKIEKFYRIVKQDPKKLADDVIKKFQQLSFQESSLKRCSEDSINLKAKKQAELLNFSKERDTLKQKLAERKPEFSETQNDSKSLIDLPNAEGSEADLLSEAQNMLKLAMFDENNSTRYYHITKELSKKQTFIMRIYSDFIHLLSKLANLLHAISDQSRDGIPAELERLCMEMTYMVREYKTNKNKHENQTIPSQIKASVNDVHSYNHLPRLDTQHSANSELLKDDIGGRESQVGILAINEVKGTFLSIFNNCVQEAEDFAFHIKQDPFVNTFQTIDDIRSCLAKFGTSEQIGTKKEMLTKAGEGTWKLHEESVDIFCKRFLRMISQYIQFYKKLTGNTTELSKVVGVLVKNDLELEGADSNSNSEERVAKRPHPFAMNNLMKTAQAKRLSMLAIQEDTNESRHATIESKAPKGSARNGKEHAQSSRQIEPLKNTFSEEEFRERLTQLTMMTLEEKRGYFYNDLQIGYKSKVQREKEMFLNQFNEKNKVIGNISENEYLELERQAIRQKEAEAVEKKRKHDLGLDKEPEKTAFEVTYGRILELKPPTDKARMLNNSNILSKIHLIESQVKNKKPLFVVQKLSNEFVKKVEVPPSPRKLRGKNNQLRSISEEKSQKVVMKPPGTGENTSARKKLAKTLQAAAAADRGVLRNKSSGNVTLEMYYTRQPFIKGHNVTSITPSNTSTQGVKGRLPLSRANSTVKVSETRFPRIQPTNKRTSLYNPRSMPSSTRSSIDVGWKPNQLGDPYLNSFHPSFFATSFEPNLISSINRKQSSILVEEQPN